MRPAARYPFAIVATLGAAVAVRLLHPVLDAGSYMVMLAAVVVTAAVAGLWPALLATVLSVAAIDFFFLAPRFSLALFAKTDALLLVLFGGMALLTTALTSRLHAGRTRAERDALEAAGIASLMQRDAEELSRDVDAMHELRKNRRK